MNIKIKSFANDSLINKDAGFGSGLDKTVASIWAENGLNQNYQLLASMYQYWLPRRIVDLIPEEACRKGWTHNIPSWTPDQIKALDKADIKFKVKEKFCTAWKWDRLFGGGLVLYLFDQSQGLYSEPLDKDRISKGSLIGLDAYDPWQSYPADIDFNNFADPNYRKPNSYTLGTPGFFSINKDGVQPQYRVDNTLNGAIVHYTRVARFNGLSLPWYSYQNNWYWGQSLLASVHEAVQKADLVTQSVAQLLFKLSVPVFGAEGLDKIVTDDIARGAFLQRLNLLNTGMSNNHMAIIDKDKESLTNLEQSGISGLDPLIERFYVLVSSAAGIPVTKLVGESAKGLNATGEGDEKNFYNTVESQREDKLKPALEEFYDIFFPSEFGIPRPEDHVIEFPSLFQESPQEVANTQSVEAQTLSLMFNDGAISKKIYIEEVMERGIVSNMTDEDKEEILNQGFVNSEEMDDALELGGSSEEEQINPYDEN